MMPFGADDTNNAVGAASSLCEWMKIYIVD